MAKTDFADKIVVVTGGAGGIGAAIAARFARAGARLALLDVDEQAAETRATQLSAAGYRAFAVGCDVAREADCRAAMGQVVSRFGGIDILVNNAGITQRSAFRDTRASVFRRVMDVNFFGALHCTQAAIEGLILRKGMIVVIESIAGVAPLLGRSGYCASKHALHGLFTSLRSEVSGSGVHIMIVCPGFVATGLQARALGADGRVTAHPQSRVGRQASPARVAEAVYRGAAGRKHLLVLSPVGKITYWLSRFVPVLYERIMPRQLKQELTQSQR